MQEEAEAVLGGRVTVRAARVDEALTIASFQVALAAESEGMRLDRPTVERGVAAVFNDPGRGRYTVAEVGGELAGCLLTLPEWSDWRNGTVLWIHSVYVVPRHRGHGVFRAMFESLRAEVEADVDLHGLRLIVDRNNVRAQKVYAALGMSDEHYRTFEWMKREG